MFDIDRPYVRTKRALEIVSIDPRKPAPIHMWQHDHGLQMGKFMGGRAGGYLYSVTEVVQLGMICVQRAMDVPLPDAIERSRKERPKVRNMLRARLEFGYWPLAIIRIGTKSPIPTTRAFSLGALCERVIGKLELPLPLVADTPPPDEASVIIETVSLYVASDEFQRRCDRLRDVVRARKRPTDWVEASIALGVPLWVIREGAKGVVEDAAEAATSAAPPISIVNVLRDRLGVTIIEAAP